MPDKNIPDLSRIHAIAFDLDGTLVDSAADIWHALNFGLSQAGLPNVDLVTVRGWIGGGPDKLISRAIDHLGLAHSDGTLHARLRADFDAVLTPAAAGVATVGLGATGSPAFNALWTYLGVPAISLPLLTVDGLPLGLQAVAPRNADAALLSAANALLASEHN